jgi:hypothetical protein
MIVFKLLSQSVCKFANRSLGLAVITIATLVSTPALSGNNDALSFGDESFTKTKITPTVNGTYLYGEADRPDVIGKEYMLFETTGNKTIGAFYLPQSEFSCFYGQFKGARMNITLIDAYDRQKYNLTLALNPNNGLTASKQPMMGEPTYFPLGTKITANEQRILDVCKQQVRG